MPDLPRAAGAAIEAGAKAPSLENGDKPVRDVALDVLIRAAWVTAEDADTARLDPFGSPSNLSTAAPGAGAGPPEPPGGC
jgi:hypothetical protein